MPAPLAAVRVGWLLRVNRLLGIEPAFRSGRTFARAFRSDPPLARSQITRWESGEVAASAATIGRYEQLLSLRPGVLTAISSAVQRFENATNVPPGRRTEDKARLHELLSHATNQGNITGAGWIELSGLVAGRPELEIHPPALWSHIADRLLTELVVDVDTSWLQRQEAMARLIDHPDAGGHAIEACITMAADPLSPAVVEPMSLLSATSDPRANSYVLLQLAQPADERALRGALLAASLKITQRRFRGDDWEQLARNLGGVLHDSSLTDDLFGIAVHAAQRIAHRASGSSQLHRALNSSRVIQHLQQTPSATTISSVCHRVAATAQAHSTHDDQGIDATLAQLIKEAVFSPNPDRRLYATMLITATPYRVPAARSILAEFTGDLTRRARLWPAAATLRALTQLDVDIHRPLVRSILTSPDGDLTTRYAAAWAAPHCPGRFAIPVWQAIFSTQLAAWARSRSPAEEQLLQGIVYGIGTDAHRCVLSEIRNDPHVPQSARTMAAWQLKSSPVLP
jgi:hypothetical protein